MDEIGADKSIIHNDKKFIYSKAVIIFHIEHNIIRWISFQNHLKEYLIIIGMACNCTHQTKSYEEMFLTYDNMKLNSYDKRIEVNEI